MGRREWTEMGKFLKDGKIVVVLQGRYAGKKAVILKTMDDNTKERPYGHCVVVGVAKTPLPITRAMCKQLKSTLTADTFSEGGVKKKFLKAAQQVFEAKYQEHEGGKWLFEKLRF